VRVPGEDEAEERAWRLVAAAFAEREPVAWPRRHARSLALAVVAAAAVAAFASPPGRAVLGSLRDAIGRERVVGVRRAAPAIVSLPGRGRLLVLSRRGPWVVQPDGAKRLLGGYDGASWSPHGLFVAVTRGHQLLAVDPKGTIRWSLARQGRLTGARWSNDGFRIAYLAGGTLRVVAGDGTGDRLLARGAGAAPPAWLPGSTAHLLAYADARGSVRLVDVDTGRVLWRSPPGPRPLQLVWADGRLVVRFARGLRVVDAGEVVRTVPAPAGAEALAAAPAGPEVALARRLPTGQTEVVLVDARGGSAPRRVFAGAGGFDGLAFSPDGAWLLLAWRAADEWLLARPHGGGRVRAFSQIAEQFDPGRADGRARFPRLAGWCC
jgi:hypothetical protein